MNFSINIGNICQIGNIDPISYQIPQNAMQCCWYISQSTDIWNYDQKLMMIIVRDLIPSTSFGWMHIRNR